MKQYTILPFLAILLSLFSLTLAAQNSGEGTFFHPKRGYYTFGINGGLAYQQSDVRSDFDGYGWGLTLGKNLYYRPGAPLAFNVRGRFLYAKMLGNDPIRSYEIGDNTTLNSNGLDYTNYPANLNEDRGFVFQNYKTNLGELSLEGVFTLNKLRERTGIIVGLYGGIGLDWYKTKTDQAGNNGLPYYDGYANINDNASRLDVLKALQTVRDGNYETTAEGFGDGGNISIMPSLGVELGYQLTPRFAILAGHRATFTRDNIIDGHQWEDNASDLYHYTSLGFRWIIEPRAAKQKKPEISMRFPTMTPYNARNSRNDIRATIRYVNSAADVTCFVNGREHPFDYSEGNFRAGLNLERGKNDVTITATNSAGSATKTVILIWAEGSVIDPPNNPNPPTVRKPNVRFTSPNSVGQTTDNQRFKVSATIQNIVNKNDIEFLMNGRRNTNFYFDSRTRKFTADVNLQNGRNDFTIRAQNDGGRDEANTNVRYEVRGNAPQVTIQKPQNNSTVRSSSTTVEATVRDVNSKNDIDFTVNGRRVTSFSFSPSNGRIRQSVNLQEGNNRIVIRASNRYGNDEASVNVRYDKTITDPGNTGSRPKVSISKPANNSTTSSSTASLKAKVENVRSKNDIKITVNNATVSNFTFNSLSGQLSANVTLKAGNNTIRVRGTNAQGSDEDNVLVKYNAGNRPTVNITQPSNNSNSGTAVKTVKATVKHVASKNKITVTHNGKTISNFSYNNQIVTVNVTLKAGNNTVKIKATNSLGSADDTVNIGYDAPRKPTVSITSPKNNTRVNKAAVTLKATVKHAVKSGITVSLNGTKVTNFSFNNTALTANLNLKVGKNTITVKAQNSDGSDQASVIVTYTRPAAKPTVKITKPAKKGTVVTKNQAKLEAKVTNVRSKNELSVTLNNKNVSFTYDVRTKTVKANLNLKAGTSTIKVTATTNAGNASDQTTIVYRRGISTGPGGSSTVTKPKVKILSVSEPATEPFNPNVGASTIIASITGVSKKSEITFIVNGRSVNNFEWDARAKRFQATVQLTRGQTTNIKISAQNSAGKDSAQRAIEF